jgi:hypothetical protein
MTRLEVPVVIERDHGCEVLERTETYELIDLPFESYRLLGGKDQLDEVEAQTYVEWMIETEELRSAYAMGVFLACGARKSSSQEWISVNLDLSSWLMYWFPVTFAPWRGEPYQGHWWLNHQGIPMGPWFPDGIYGEVYSPMANWLEVSLAHDIAFIVAEAARRVDPNLQWQVSTIALPESEGSEPDYHLPMLNSRRPGVIPTKEVFGVLQRTLRVPQDANTANRLDEEKRAALSKVYLRLVDPHFPF